MLMVFYGKPYTKKGSPGVILYKLLQCFFDGLLFFFGEIQGLPLTIASGDLSLVILDLWQIGRKELVCFHKCPQTHACALSTATKIAFSTSSYSADGY